jgi:hypothetical protein
MRIQKNYFFDLGSFIWIKIALKGFVLGECWELELQILKPLLVVGFVI